MKTHRSGRDGASGEMAERSKAAVSKIAVRATVPRVRIPLSPPLKKSLPRSAAFCFSVGPQAAGPAQ